MPIVDSDMIPKKTREFFTSLMEAQAQGTAITYDKDTECYSGIFDTKTLNKFIDEGVLELVDEIDGLVTIILNGRDDFLSGFAGGMKEASNGNDQYYADYNANAFAFSVGYEHYIRITKKRLPTDYVCHGFEVNGEIYNQ